MSEKDLAEFDKLIIKQYVFDAVMSSFMRGMDRKIYKPDENIIFMKNITKKTVDKILQTKRYPIT